MIHLLNYTGARDFELKDLMLETFDKYCPNPGTTWSRDMDNVDNKAWGNGAGWEASLLKIDGIRRMLMLADVADLDWLLLVDSDIVFCSSDVFDFVNSIDGGAGICGIHQGGQLAQCSMGDLHNFSGCSIYLRGWVARRMASLTQSELDNVRADFKRWVITENEDVVVSYIAQMLGAAYVPLPNKLYHSDLGFELDLINSQLKPMYHLNYHTEWFNGKFLGVPVAGKWDIPKALREKGIEL